MCRLSWCGVSLQVHGEVVRVFAEGADQHLKHEEQASQDKAMAAKTGTSYQPRPDPFPVPVLIDYLQKCLAATIHSRRYDIVNGRVTAACAS